MYKRIFTEADDNDLNELVGELKGQFKTIKQVKGCTKFKKLSDADKEYLLDELKADGFKESVISEGFDPLELDEVMYVLKQYKKDNLIKMFSSSDADKILDSYNYGKGKFTIENVIDEYFNIN